MFGSLNKLQAQILSNTFLAFFLGLTLTCSSAFGAPKPDLWDRWTSHDPGSTERVDHSKWKTFLDAYLVYNHPSGINRVKYGEVGNAGLELLEAYLAELSATKISTLSMKEQKPFWINLYNALTIKVVVDHYPVDSIKEIDISPGWFSDGPWGKKLISVEGEEVSLDDVEHRILRPIWRDNRVHYAVNCASIGCPNLQPVPFTAENTDALLDRAAADYVNHPRGVTFQNEVPVLSSIYDWFAVDFGDSVTGVMEHLKKHASSVLAEKLDATRGYPYYEYDWSLNDSP